MSSENALDIINSIIGAEMYAEEHHGKPKGPVRPLVTVSRYFGANSTEISRLLAQRLGVQLYDRELLDAVIKESNADKYLVERLDEHSTSFLDDVVHSFFSKKSASSEDFYHNLIKVLMGIAQAGGVIVGRGAHLLLPKRQVFRLRIEGSLEVCTKRVAERMDIKPGKAEKLIIATNKERTRFVKELYRRYPSNKAYYDMVVNTDMFSDDQVVEIVALAMKFAGFKVPPREVSLPSPG